MTDSESYYKVPVGEETTLRGDKHEMSLSDHLFMTGVGFALFGVAQTTGPIPVGWFGLFLVGYALNNAVIAWRCDRVDGGEER